MEITRQQIIDFFENKCSAEEAEQVYHYLQQHPEIVQEYLNEAEWESFSTSATQDEAWVAQRFENIQGAKIKLRVIPWKRISRVAAAVLLLVAAAGVFTSTLRQNKVPVIVAEAPLKEVLRDTVITNTGTAKKRIQLSDGSVVLLSAESKLQLQQPFDKAKRDIQLTGEAVFHVAKNSASIFTVYTTGFSTTALGTVFSIKAYEEQATSSIKLLEGKVMVKNLKLRQPPQYLAKGQACVFDMRNNTLVKKQQEEQVNKQAAVISVAKANNSVIENENDIEFRNAPLPRVLEVISNTYDINIISRNEHLKNRKFTGTFRKDQSIESVLQTIASLNDLQISKDEAGYHIVRK